MAKRRRMTASRAHQVYRILKGNMDRFFRKAIHEAQAAVAQSNIAKLRSAVKSAREASFWARDLSLFMNEVVAEIRQKTW